MREYTSKRMENTELVVKLEGEEFTLRPGKRSGALINLLAVDKNDKSKEIAYTKALLEWFEKSLDRTHGKTAKQPGHGQDVVVGCQACRLWDRLNDDDDPLELDTVLDAANDAIGDLADRPTG